jgi:hypothetical protein
MGQSLSPSQANRAYSGPIQSSNKVPCRRPNSSPGNRCRRVNLSPASRPSQSGFEFGPPPEAVPLTPYPFWAMQQVPLWIQYVIWTTFRPVRGGRMDYTDIFE